MQRLLETPCEPRVGGTKTYRVAGTIRYERDRARDVTRDFYTDQFKMRCPTTEERRFRQADAFRDLSFWHPNPSDYERRQPSTQLRRILGSPPYKPAGVKNAWQAHHIVPVGDRRARAARALLFRCQIHPNASLNGYWLRGAGLIRVKRDGAPNPAYRKLRRKRPDLARRAYHADSFTDAYFRVLSRAFGTSIQADDACRGANGSYRLRVVAQLKNTLRRGLAQGNLGFENRSR